MITFERVTKRYPGGTVAVDALDLEVPAGKTMVLVGPSGCGKTTTLRMINRLVEPTEGRVLLDGRDVRQSNPAQLRRGIGYVIQQTGLFPHRTVQDNIATVPLLDGWPRKKARARARDLLALVGLDPALAPRYPYQLSGGQQQRVGVARALAADPPVLLMDEPFSAVDPLIRASLQDELVRLQTELRKTVVLVTHDIEEAIKVGDLVALYRPDGRLAQVDAPQRLLGMPVDSYVSDFVGFDRGIRLLSFFRATGLNLRAEPIVGSDSTVAKALGAARDAGQPWILVTDSDGKPRGWLPAERLAPLADDTPLGTVPAEEFGHTFTVETDSLRAALDAALLSPAGQAIGVDSAGRVAGLLSYDQLRAAVQAAEATTKDAAGDAEQQPRSLRA
ncbi:MAG: ATP-binding cassette domain-containing protein [Streptosporangiaceae bacterium]|nr:ATP-binding cassette domain-containing protein [Streptosporangiaceae bacterium]